MTAIRCALLIQSMLVPGSGAARFVWRSSRDILHLRPCCAHRRNRDEPPRTIAFRAVAATVAAPDRTPALRPALRRRPCPVAAAALRAAPSRRGRARKPARLPPGEDAGRDRADSQPLLSAAGQGGGGVREAGGAFVGGDEPSRA